MDPTAHKACRGNSALRIRLEIGRAASWKGLFYLSVLLLPLCANASESRRTPLVRAVEQARDAIVNIRGQKLVPARTTERGEGTRKVNGMGTGVLIDRRGYIVTNFHVIDGVSTINVTLSDGTRFVANSISHDPRTDLAIIKIDPDDRTLPVIQLGTSKVLMPGDTVIAVGIAYGYEHTVVDHHDAPP